MSRSSRLNGCPKMPAAAREPTIPHRDSTRSLTAGECRSDRPDARCAWRPTASGHGAAGGVARTCAPLSSHLRSGHQQVIRPLGRNRKSRSERRVHIARRYSDTGTDCDLVMPGYWPVMRRRSGKHAPGVGADRRPRFRFDAWRRLYPVSRGRLSSAAAGFRNPWANRLTYTAGGAPVDFNTKVSRFDTASESWYAAPLEGVRKGVRATTAELAPLKTPFKPSVLS
jgi:hypothetical protein